METLGVVSTDERRGLYWATAGFDFPTTSERMILPRRWVAESPLFVEVHDDLDPSRLADLARRRGEFAAEPTLEKCVGEAVYERVRERVLPDAPSRLDCLWAAPDMFAAIDFAQAYFPPPTFDPATGFADRGTPVSTADGRWVALDMHLFEIPASVEDDESAIANALADVEAIAERYWRGDATTTPFVEIVAERLWQYTAFITEAGLPPPYVEWRVHNGHDSNGH